MPNAPSDPARDLIVLVTGFGPFRDVAHNPSGHAAEHLDGSLVTIERDSGIVRARIIGRGDVPVVFRDPAGSSTSTGAGYVAELLATLRPDVVIALGVAADEPGFRIETEAHNVIVAAVGDNRSEGGYAPIGAKTVMVRDRLGRDVLGYLHSGDQKTTLKSTLPIEAIRASIERRGVTCRASRDAGKYVCEDVMWEILAANGGSALRAGFLHVPALGGPNEITQEIVDACVLSAVEATIASIAVEEVRSRIAVS